MTFRFVLRKRRYVLRCVLRVASKFLDSDAMMYCAEALCYTVLTWSKA